MGISGRMCAYSRSESGKDHPTPDIYQNSSISNQICIELYYKDFFSGWFSVASNISISCLLAVFGLSSVVMLFSDAQPQARVERDEAQIQGGRQTHCKLCIETLQTRSKPYLEHQWKSSRYLFCTMFSTSHFLKIDNCIPGTSVMMEYIIILKFLREHS